MKKFIKFIALVLVLCTIFATLCACGGGEEEESSTADVSKVDVLFSGLPDVNYGDEEFVILVPGDDYTTYMSEEIMPQATTPQVLADNIIDRNDLVESTFGVKITEVRTANNSTEDMIAILRAANEAGLDDYDLAMPYIPEAATLALEDSFYLLNDLEYIDLSKDCWDENATSGLSIRNKNYFATGDISLLSLACTHAIVFNKDMVTEYGLENPYDLVNNGEWTLDKLREMAKEVTNDSDGTVGMGYKDHYGFLVNSNYTTSMFVGAGENLTIKNANDEPVIAVNSESAVSTFSKIFDLVNDTTATGKIDDTAGGYYTSAVNAGLTCWDAATESVANKKALFRSMAIIDIIDLGEYECNFGILPTPKLNKEQDDYYSFVSTLYATCIAIPSSLSAEAAERSSVIAQALCEASTDTTKNAYYEIVLKKRKIQDVESEAMLDYIFSSRVYDIGVVFSWGGESIYDTNGIGQFLNTIAYSGNETFASTYESIKDVIQADIDETLEKFE